MVFYAYSKTVSNEYMTRSKGSILTSGIKSLDEASWRYLIVAPTMEVLDEWYRALQKKLPAGAITRKSPEFYVHDHSKVDLGRTTAKDHQTPEFVNLVTFTLLYDVTGREYPTFYNKHVVDHISGNSYVILH
jgi:hypothetical protein